MTVKEYLHQGFTISKQIKSKQEQIIKLRDMQTNVTTTLSPDKVQTTPNPDKLGDFTSALIDLENDYIQDVTKLLRLKYDIKRLIEKLDNPKCRLILEERYINLKQWENIAADNYYSWPHVHRLHAEALKEIECYYVSMISCSK